MQSINSFSGEFAFLSNFFPREVKVLVPLLKEEFVFASSEHAYQALKATTEQGFNFVASSVSPGVAKKRGRMITYNPMWEMLKIPAMREVIRAKFTQHEDLKQLLLNTNDIYLREGNTWGDKFWGCVFNSSQWIGFNHLGNILMQVREELRNAS